MHVILTHEQADFDALAAALGAALMHQEACAVTPRRLNRNVRAFLTLYGAELPFIDVRDLPAQPIETITLVDTQSLITLKGTTPQTTVQVVDHHALRPELPAGWTVKIDPVGACTTLFVEGLRELDAPISPVHASLLLLGIYEDTGSLSYISTTPRDVRAAAYLMEAGASLQLLSRYLNPPLSEEQRQVYDRLLADAERHQIHGQTVLISSAAADEMTDEISTIAHKLRDLLDPDALFLLVRTPEGIRLVARSLTDQIDVSKVAEYFGGGGHGRAAAALIRQSSITMPGEASQKTPALEEVRAELVRIIPEHVRPGLAVRHIMSARPLLLEPNTPAVEAARLMQRYGYEGYPVVKDGKVAGLLTRRAVDRALSHKLNLTAASLMDSGEVTISPQDTLEQLRRVMTESGWGQVPVVDPQTQQVIGIVTRTDLLKTAAGLPSAERQNLAARLEQALSPARLALLRAVAAQALEQRVAAYIVGGFVRDLLMGRPSPDFDLVIEGDAIALANALVEKYGGKLLPHTRFGTAKWTLTSREDTAARLESSTGSTPDDLPLSLDLISARTEFYDYPTALPTVERSSIKLDLHRRDFTINTMALRLDGRHYGELYDYWGGLRDLRRGIVRVLHSLSFVDDPTRVMRAVRFEQRFGFTIEQRTCQLIGEAHDLIHQVSGDRLRHEFNLILAEERAAAMLARLQKMNLLSAIHPALAWSEDWSALLEQALHSQPEAFWNLPERHGSLPLQTALAYMVWFAQLPGEAAAEIYQRLRLPRDVQEAYQAAQSLLEALPALLPLPASAVVQRMAYVPDTALYLAFLLSQTEEHRALIYRYAEKWRAVQPITNGNTLRALGIAPGPRYKKILWALRAAWLDGIIDTQVQETAMLQRLLQEHQPLLEPPPSQENPG